jgi:tripartite-type tricarboxylate transporter receptor subunit TctC
MAYSKPKLMQRHAGIVVAHAIVTASAIRAEDYPTRPVTIIVPFPPGGSIDGTARMLAQNLADRLKQSKTGEEQVR